VFLIYVSKRINKISFNLKLLTINSASGASKFLNLQKYNKQLAPSQIHRNATRTWNGNQRVI